MNTNKLLMAFLLILLTHFLVIVAVGQNDTEQLLEKRVSISFEKESLGKILGHLIENYGISFGLEESSLDMDHNDYDYEPNLINSVDWGKGAIGQSTYSVHSVQPVFEVERHTITVKVENVTLKNVIQLIVNQMANYKWELDNGVVNIFPSQGRDPRFERLLSLKIKNFSLIKPNLAVGMVYSRVTALPEFKQFLKENNMGLDNIRPGLVDHLFRKLPHNLQFENLTLRELLNKITAVKKGGWILRQSKTQLQQNNDIEMIL